ncbi:acyl-CoA thioesterase [Haloarchaeobius sp. TZWWS8]|uniref:acyl-CoA thioesterase n=1 Tax=Haloarchaeobius sp. TZWWS8 TaxID=3446121 RepID=UPI003EB81C14
MVGTRDEPFTTDIDIRFNDVDLAGHVNNAIYVSYLEEARVDYLTEVIGGLDSLDGVIANLEIDYHRPVTLDDEVEVAVAVTEIGSSSFEMTYEVRASGDVAATGSTVMVAYDFDTGESRPIPEEWRELVREYEGL